MKQVSYILTSNQLVAFLILLSLDTLIVFLLVATLPSILAAVIAGIVFVSQLVAHDFYSQSPRLKTAQPPQQEEG